MEKGLLERAVAISIGFFESCKLDSLEDICFYQQPYLSLESLADFISLIHHVAVKNRNNKFEPFLDEPFLKRLHIFLRCYFDSADFFAATIHQ